MHSVFELITHQEQIGINSVITHPLLFCTILLASLRHVVQITGRISRMII